MKKDDIELGSNVKFGAFFGAVLFAASLYFLIHDEQVVFVIFMGVAVSLFLMALIKAELLEPANRLWMNLGWRLGLFISPIVLGLIFFGLFTPVAVTLRVIGRDELRLKVRNERSYWKVRNLSENDSVGFKNQF